MASLSIKVTATHDWVTVDGIPCRMWDGFTDSGIPVQAAIIRIAPGGGGISAKDWADRFAAEANAAGLRPPSHPESKKQNIQDGA